MKEMVIHVKMQPKHLVPKNMIIYVIPRQHIYITDDSVIITYPYCKLKVYISCK